MAIKAADQLTIVDLTDAYSVILTSESYTFPGTTTAAKAGSCTTQVIAMCGASTVAASVNLSDVTKPTGVTVTKDTNATSPTLTITVDSNFTTPGDVVIPVSLDNGNITISKRFSVSIAFTGATGAAGKGIKSTAVTYQAGTSGTTAPTGTWQSSVPSVAEGQYLWCKTVITYTDNSTSTSYSLGRMGTNGQNGANGADGADAITMAVTSSNGTIFKNSAIETVLTAHVYKAGTEITDNTALAALGTVKWYKDGGTTAVATGRTLTVSAGNVTNKATYTAQLEM